MLKTDSISVCWYCGSVMKTLTKEQIKIFGKQICCEYPMVSMDRNKILVVAKALDTLKKNLEIEILQGML